MNLPLILRPEAESDLAQAKSHYEEERQGLGVKFVTQVQMVLDRIVGMPELYALIWRDVRPCKLRRFPYVLYYRILPDRIEVIGVVHGSRDATVWQGRA